MNTNYCNSVGNDEISTSRFIHILYNDESSDDNGDDENCDMYGHNTDPACTNVNHNEDADDDEEEEENDESFQCFCSSASRITGAYCGCGDVVCHAILTGEGDIEFVLNTSDRSTEVRNIEGVSDRDEDTVGCVAPNTVATAGDCQYHIDKCYVCSPVTNNDIGKNIGLEFPDENVPHVHPAFEQLSDELRVKHVQDDRIHPGLSTCVMEELDTMESSGDFTSTERNWNYILPNSDILLDGNLPSSCDNTLHALNLPRKRDYPNSFGDTFTLIDIQDGDVPSSCMDTSQDLLHKGHFASNETLPPLDTIQNRDNPKDSDNLDFFHKRDIPNDYRGTLSSLDILQNRDIPSRLEDTSPSMQKMHTGSFRAKQILINVEDHSPQSALQSNDSLNKQNIYPLSFRQSIHNTTAQNPRDGNIVTKETETFQNSIVLPGSKEWLDGKVKPSARHWVEYMWYMNYSCQSSEKGGASPYQRVVRNWPIPVNIHQTQLHNENENLLSSPRTNYCREKRQQKQTENTDRSLQGERQCRDERVTMRFDDSLFVLTGTPTDKAGCLNSTTSEEAIVTAMAIDHNISHLPGFSKKLRSSYLTTIPETEHSDVKDGNLTQEDNGEGFPTPEGWTEIGSCESEGDTGKSYCKSEQDIGKDCCESEEDTGKSYCKSEQDTGKDCCESEVDTGNCSFKSEKEMIKMDWGSRTPFVFTGNRKKGKQVPTILEQEIPEQESDYCHDIAGSLGYVDHVPPLPTRRKTSSGLGQSLIRRTTLDRDKRHRASLPAQVIGEYTVQNGRSPAKRKRDSFLKRRHNSASAIQMSTVSSSVPSSLSSMSECNEDGCGTTDDVHISNTNDPQSQAFTRLQLNVDDPSSKFNRKEHPVHSNSCPQIETSSYQMFDIVGDESGIKFPWQRDASTQCNIQIDKVKYTKSSSVDTSPSSSSSLATPNNLSLSYLDCGNRGGLGIVRPHSIGCLEGTVHEGEIERLRQEQARKARKSDSFLQVSPRSVRKRPSLAVSDDHGSVSDLGSISENPDIEGRDFGLEESHMADLSSELRRIALKSAEQYRDTNILPSPRVSPTLFNGSHLRNSGSDSDDCSGPDTHSRKYLTIPRKSSRRRSSLSLTSVSDESDVEPSPPVARRGRRAAIVDTKNFGDVSPTTLSPEVSPSNSCDEGDNASNIAERLRRRKSSVDLTMNVYPGDLLVHDHHRKLMKRNTIADLYSQKNGSSSSISDDHKKGRQSFSLRKLMKTRSKESIPRLEDVLSQMKPSEFRDNHLSAYKNLHWSDLIASSDKQTDTVKLPEVERKRREAVWELFKSECVFLIDHLMVLKHCFMEPLKKVQVEGHVMFAEPQDIFGNLDELCYVSYTFCKDFISALLKDMSSTDFGSTSVLIRAFERFTTHSRDGGVYHIYCLNYVNALTYLEQLRRHEDFTEFEKWCTQDPRCNRLQLTDLLVAPMQHCTKFPLLLNNIKKYTDNNAERKLLTELIDKVGVSLQKMEDKMKWAKNYERLQEIQGQLVWPSVADIDPRAFVPDFLKTALTKQPCERMICSPKRQLIHEGYLTLVESAKTSDVYVFLFDDILLITRTKKPQRKKHSIDSVHIRLQQSGQSERIVHTVYRQPVALDRLSVHDITPSDATANGLKHAFVLVQISRYQQIIGVFTLQAVTDSHKAIWVEKLSHAREKFNSVPDILANQLSSEEDSKVKDGLISSDIVRATKSNRRAPSLRNPHGKSLSMDAVYL